MGSENFEIDPAHQVEYQSVSIEFTGSGSEYFRIWIVNMLLLLVTLGLYWPWAKVRRLRYFWGNTLVDGDALGFHGNPRQMFKGWVLVAVLFGLYNWAGNLSPVAGLVAFVLLALIWPALWRSSMVFRMANTSWRGLRMQFVGSLRDAYMAFLPLLLAVLPFMLVSLIGEGKGKATPPFWVTGVLLVSMLAVVGAMPWLLWRMKAYQHRHYVLGPLQTEFRASVRSFYGLSIKPFLVMVGASVLLGAVMFFLVFNGGKPGLKQIAYVPMVVLLFWGLFLFGLGPWWTTRLQNLVWTKTGNSQVRFVSRLGLPQMLWLSLKNGLLIAVTLGLYWPFAKVAMARLRLEAVHLRTVTDLHELLASEQPVSDEAAGDAAGDFFGLDVGL